MLCFFSLDIVKLGQAEIENLHSSLVGNKDIRRLDIAMDDPFPVSSLQSFCNLDRNVEQRLKLKRRRPPPVSAPAASVMISRSVRPSSNSITMNGCCSYSST